MEANFVSENELDLLWGASAIARFIGCTDQQAFRMLSEKQIPGKKVGRQWVVKRSDLAEFFSRGAA